MDLEIIKIASDTKNFKDIENYTNYSSFKNPLCGDEIHIKLIIKNQKVVDFGYQGNSCVYCQATSSLLSKKLINWTTFKINELCDYVKNYFDQKDEILDKRWKFLEKLLSKKNIAKKECILLPFNALKKIVVKL
tara:strand:- start:480 stop:881 length:402 start_codon:yes stop_codon:yes gene_type:complete